MASVSTLSLLLGGALVGVIAWLSLRLRYLQARFDDLSRAYASQSEDLDSARLDLQRLSTDDSLTALANHEQFLDFVEREWRRARREATPVSLVFLDVDHFRSFNRQYGRRAGDECLRQIGRALEGLAGRAGDLIARYHRDEFAVVLAGTDATGALRVANRIRLAVENLQLPAAGDAESPVVTVSVAVACAVPERQSAWEELDLIKAARHALGEARAAGGNRVLTTTLHGPAVPAISAVVR